MRIPESLTDLVDSGIIEAVLRPLMSGKEAQIYLLRSGGELRVAKVYKAAQDRSFRQRAEYTEGRKVRNTRDQRAMSKRTRHGREQDEIAWRATEVDMIYRLHAAGVRVPKPFQFIDGVLIMELIVDDEGNPAPRLGDVALDREGAIAIYEQLIRYVVQMLCADVVHGDLSEFNVLMTSEGPVIIDLPQAVNAAGNQNARKLLLRDVENLHRFVTGYAPELKPLPYAQEMWQLYERGELTPDVRLTGRYRAAEHKADTSLVLDLIADAERDERRRRTAKGLNMRGAGDAVQSRGPDPRQAQPRQAQQPPRPQPGQAPQPPRPQPGQAQPPPRPQPRQAQQSRPQPAVEQRRRPPDVRTVQPARAQHPGGQHRQAVDPRHAQPARAQHAQHAGGQHRQAVEPRHAQPARAQNPNERRAPRPDVRPPQPAAGQNPSEQRRHSPQRDTRQAQPSHPRNASDQRWQSRDAHQPHPQPAHTQSVTQGRGQTPVVETKRSSSNPPLPASGRSRHESYKE